MQKKVRIALGRNNVTQVRQQAKACLPYKESWYIVLIRKYCCMFQHLTVSVYKISLLFIPNASCGTFYSTDIFQTQLNMVHQGVFTFLHRKKNILFQQNVLGFLFLIERYVLVCDEHDLTVFGKLCKWDKHFVANDL